MPKTNETITPDIFISDELHLTPAFDLEDGLQIGIEITEDGENWYGVMVNKEQALQLIQHFKQQFSL